MTFQVPEGDSLRTVPLPPEFSGELGDSNYSVQLSPVPRNYLVAGQFYFKARVDPQGDCPRSPWTDYPTGHSVTQFAAMTLPAAIGRLTFV
jgi:hypothetical protein